MNRLTLLQENVEKCPSGRWKNKYLCLCGNEFITRKDSVKNGLSKSCGCLNRELASARVVKVSTTHDMKYSREYVTWNAMKQRCTNKNNSNYPSYGGSGITISKEWLVFERFYADMGVRPADTSIDRIDNTKGYFKENCRWATHKEQMKNRRPKSEWKANEQD